MNEQTELEQPKPDQPEHPERHRSKQPKSEQEKKWATQPSNPLPFMSFYTEDVPDDVAEPYAKTPILLTNCFTCARFNRGHCYKSLELELVIGSLGFVYETVDLSDEKLGPSSSSSVWWEFGGPQYTKVTDFLNHHGTWDAHSWLEDKEGRVYDVVQRTWFTIAKLYKCHRGKIESGLVLEARTKEELRKQFGLVYHRPEEKLHSKLIARFNVPRLTTPEGVMMLGVYEEMLERRVLNMDKQ